MSKHQIQNDPLTFWPGLAAALICISFGANAVAIKITLSGIGVFTTAALRFGIASLAISAWALVTGRPFGIRKDQVLLLLLISVLFTIQLSSFYLGIDKTYASRAVLIGNLQPFFVLILAHFFIPGDSMTKKKVIGIVMGFAGVLAIFIQRKEITAELRIGDLLVFGAVVIWACNAIIIKKVIADFQPFHLVLYPIIFSVPVFILMGWKMDQPMIRHLDTKVVGGMLYQCLVTASFGFVAWTTMLRKYGAVAVHSFLFLMPIAGVVLSGILLHEPVATKYILISLVLITSGIVIVHFNFKGRG